MSYTPLISLYHSYVFTQIIVLIIFVLPGLFNSALPWFIMMTNMISFESFIFTIMQVYEFVLK